MNRQKVLFLVLILAMGASLVFPILLSNLPFCPSSRKPISFNTSYYVWNTQWTPSVLQAMERSAAIANHFMVLTAEIHIQDEHPILDRINSAWDTLDPDRFTITPVIRMGDSLAPYLAHHSTDDLIVKIDRIFARSTRSNPISRLQLDYDCPTAKLDDYKDLLISLRQQYPTTTLSITALPDWLNHPRFLSIAQSVDYYVLQVHCLEKPTMKSDSVHLYRSIQRTQDMTKAEALGVPFYLAFPTYGYEMVFDAQGRYRGIQTGSTWSEIQPEYTTRLLMADPDEIAADVRFLTAYPRKACLGIAWFRLPIGSERLNWNWPTLQAVMQGRAPQTAFQTEIRSSTDGLVELWISNTGECNTFHPLTFANPMRQYPILAFDTLSGYQLVTEVDQFSGPAPKVDHPLLAAWYRLMPHTSIQSSTIEIHSTEVSKP